MDMSIFYEDEIRKALERSDPSDLEKFMSQDPRRKQSWTSRSQSNSRNQRRTNRNRSNSRNRPDNWGKYDE